jgi:hypothetical protein
MPLVKESLMGKASAPPAPDYVGAAQAQGAANKEAAVASGKLSNPSFSNPLGSRDVQFGYKGDPEQVFIQDSLTPIGQQRFDQEQRINTGLGDIAESGLGYVEGALDNPFDTASLPARSINAGQTAQDAILSRLEPQIAKDRETLRTQLVNQGIRGGEASDDAYRVQGQRENDLRIAAALQGIQTGDQARQQAIQEQSFLRSEPLNMLNAVRSASPVAMPQFQGYSGTNIQAAPLMQAAQAQGQADLGLYNAKVGQQNAGLGMLGTIGAAAVPYMFSDRRLKSNVVRIGTHRCGVPLYAYDIFGRRDVGVMADEVAEVRPDAVMQHESGFLMVNYGAL